MRVRDKKQVTLVARCSACGTASMHCHICIQYIHLCLFIDVSMSIGDERLGNYPADHVYRGVIFRSDW